uniref:DNA 3'-5' helicase n=1 Tax=Magallana gigas TaxID=29159 RepID=K1Q7R9_MAGGI
MAALSLESIVLEILPDFGVSVLKPEQKEIIKHAAEKKDCIAVLPTGFGKSLPFQLYAAAQKRMNQGPGSVHVLVCSPLIALMKDQTKKMSRISHLNVGYKDDTVFTILPLAEEYQVLEVKERCETFIIQTLQKSINHEIQRPDLHALLKYASCADL